MSYYLKDGEIFWPTEKNAYDIRDKLPLGTYHVGSHPMRGFYLKPIEPFEITGKVYGDTLKNADRIINTFNDRPYTTGVLLSGDKGSGKTLLAKKISQQAREQFGISTLVINTPYCGDSFNLFMQSINEPCIVMYDEFEKVFNAEQQEATLTLLDGVYPTKKMFLLTVNDKYRVNQHMKNRPGRIFYMLEYKGLTSAFIREYCVDNLKNQAHVEQMARLTLIFDTVNFDMLKALVEEMNRYDESPNKALEMLNAKPNEGGEAKYILTGFYKGKEVTNDKVQPRMIRGTPLSQDEMDIGFYVPSETDPTDDEYVEVELVQGNMKRIDTEKGTFTYIMDEGSPEQKVVVFTRTNPPAPHRWMDAW